MFGADGCLGSWASSCSRSGRSSTLRSVDGRSGTPATDSDGAVCVPTAPEAKGDESMAVMVTFTLKTDPATYQALHEHMLALAIPAGLLFHSGREVGGQVGIVDFWP